MHLSMTVCIDAPTDDVWRHLADLESIALWAPGIRTAQCAPGRERGVGAERVCELTGGITLVEEWLDWVDGVSFTYEGRGLPGVAWARNTWTVAAVGDKTLLRSDAEVQLLGRGRLRVMEPMLAWQSRRMGRRSLGNLKHLIERGSLPASRRTTIPASC